MNRARRSARHCACRAGSALLLCLSLATVQAQPPAAAPAECRNASFGERFRALFTDAATVAPVDADTVRYLDDKLARAVIVRSLSARRAAAPGDEVTVDVHFLNCSAQRIQLGARVTFMDAGQRPVGRPSAWQPLHLLPGATGVYSERSLGEADVHHFVVEVRDGGRAQ